MRRVSNVDLTQNDIVQKLRKCGVSVQHLHSVGAGCPDVLAGWRNVNVLLEIKGDKTPVNKCQQDWHAKWGGQVAVVRSFDEAMEAVIKAVEGK
jgi:hypothetical protein